MGATESYEEIAMSMVEISRVCNAQGFAVPTDTMNAERVLDRMSSRIERGHRLPGDDVVLAHCRSVILKDAEQEIAQALGLC